MIKIGMTTLHCVRLIYKTSPTRARTGPHNNGVKHSVLPTRAIV